MNQVEMKAEVKTEGEQTRSCSVTQVSDPVSRGMGLREASFPEPLLSLRLFRDVAEMHAISQALDKTGWNRRRAAQLLSISYRGLLYKIRRHNIAPPAAQQS